MAENFGNIDQDLYRARFNYRQATVRETGETVFVDDNTFDPTIHDELTPATSAPVLSPEGAASTDGADSAPIA